MFQRVANQTLSVSTQPAVVTVEGPVSKMSPPTNDVTSVVAAAPPPPPSPDNLPRVPPANPTINTLQNHKRTANDFIFGKVVGEGSFSTVSIF